MSYVRFPSARFGDARPNHAGLQRVYVAENLEALMDESPEMAPWPFTNGAPSKTGTAYDDAACFWRTNKMHVRDSRVRRYRGFRFYFRAAITAGAGTAAIRFWCGRRYAIPPAAVPWDFTTTTTGAIAGAAANYGPYTLTPTVGSVFRAALGFGLGEEPRPYPLTYLGAQAIVSAGGTTVEIQRFTFEEMDP